eukprot:872398-Pelagomonas_calceolata.AAC.8
MDWVALPSGPSHLHARAEVHFPTLTCEHGVRTGQCPPGPSGSPYHHCRALFLRAAAAAAAYRRVLQ